jgi:hypothetical protein
MDFDGFCMLQVAVACHNLPKLRSGAGKRSKSVATNFAIEFSRSLLCKLHPEVFKFDWSQQASHFNSASKITMHVSEFGSNKFQHGRRSHLDVVPI